MIAVLLTVICCIMMIVFPQEAIASGRKAINLWMQDVLPALLPFFICAGFLQNIGVMRYLKAGVFPFAMSVLSGYPMGAGIIGNLRRSGELTVDEAGRMLSYCSTSGPAFMIGAVGAGMMGSGKLGVVIAAAHYCGALINGAVYGGSAIRGKRSHKNIKRESLVSSDLSGMETAAVSCYETDILGALTDAMIMAFRSLGIILAYIVIFMFITDILTSAGIFALIKNPWSEALVKGMLEMTVGCEAAAGMTALSKTAQCVLCSFIVSWGGMSVLGQTMSMLAGTGITISYVVIMKLTHGLFSAGVAFVLSLFML